MKFLLAPHNSPAIASQRPAILPPVHAIVHGFRPKSSVGKGCGSGHEHPSQNYWQKPSEVVSHHRRPPSR
ncbi:MAG TPA: hypothetical protein VNM47_06565 [Terriglobia bacterium]|nr:hypothetical protein [Terriglobia bacterium]